MPAHVHVLVLMERVGGTNKKCANSGWVNVYQEARRMVPFTGIILWRSRVGEAMGFQNFSLLPPVTPECISLQSPRNLKESGSL